MPARLSPPPSHYVLGQVQGWVDPLERREQPPENEAGRPSVWLPLWGPIARERRGSVAPSAPGARRTVVLEVNSTVAE